MSAHEMALDRLPQRHIIPLTDYSTALHYDVVSSYGSFPAVMRCELHGESLQMLWPTERSQPMPRPTSFARVLALLVVLGVLLAACGGTAPAQLGAGATTAPAAQATAAPAPAVQPTVAPAAQPT